MLPSKDLLVLLWVANTVVGQERVVLQMPCRLAKPQKPAKRILQDLKYDYLLSTAAFFLVTVGKTQQIGRNYSPSQGKALLACFQ
jgi:hypothetical protein